MHIERKFKNFRINEELSTDLMYRAYLKAFKGDQKTRAAKILEEIVVGLTKNGFKARKFDFSRQKVNPETIEVMRIEVNPHTMSFIIYTRRGFFLASPNPEEIHPIPYNMIQIDIAKGIIEIGSSNAISEKDPFNPIKNTPGFKHGSPYLTKSLGNFLLKLLKINPELYPDATVLNLFNIEGIN